MLVIKFSYKLILLLGLFNATCQLHILWMWMQWDPSVGSGENHENPH